jgi:hypothetical protein
VAVASSQRRAIAPSGSSEHLLTESLEIPTQLILYFLYNNDLPERGLEPLRIAPPDPKSGASANFATPASLKGTAIKP